MTNVWLTLYVGVTSNLIQRVWQYNNDLVKGFASKYKLHNLVYFERLDTIETAIIREKQIKDMNRKEKINMIQKMNPNYRDLYAEIIK